MGVSAGQTVSSAGIGAARRLPKLDGVVPLRRNLLALFVSPGHTVVLSAVLVVDQHLRP
jgi:hypothetical protein